MQRNACVAGLTARLHSLYEESRFAIGKGDNDKMLIRKVEELMVTATEEELQFQRKRLQSYKTEIRAIRSERDTVGDRNGCKQILNVTVLGVKV